MSADVGAGWGFAAPGRGVARKLGAEPTWDLATDREKSSATTRRGALQARLAFLPPPLRPPPPLPDWEGLLGIMGGRDDGGLRS